MSIVFARERESIESLLRRFKKVCDDEGILQEVKKRERYFKPSEIKRQKAISRKKLFAKLKLREEEAIKKEMQ